jgi:hypothetical protein
MTQVVKSNDASLSDLTVDGTTVTGFASDKLTYDVELAAGTTTVPTVDAVTTDAAASFVVNPAPSLPGTTTVDVTAEDGTVAQYVINFSVAEGIDPSSQMNIRIYPNPVREVLKIENTENSIVSIYELNGRLLRTIHDPGNVITIDVSDLGAGVYLIKVQMSKGVSISKFIKQ